MDESHKKHILKQALLNALICGVINSIMTYVLFPIGENVPVWGINGFAVDLVPTTFAAIGASMLMPGLATEKAVRNGVLQPLPTGGRRLPGSAITRALILSSIIAPLLGGVMWLCLLLADPVSVSFFFVLAFKFVYGAALGLVVARVAVIQALLPRS